MRIPITAIPFGAVLVILQIQSACTFILPVSSVCSSKRASLKANQVLLARDKNGDEDADDEIDITPDDADMESVRRSLEELIVDDSSKGSDKDLPAPAGKVPILTAARRRNLEREIELLEQLISLDENELEELQQHNQGVVMSELWALWYGERGVAPGRELKEIEYELVDKGGPSTWPEAEAQYRALIAKHCRGSSLGGMEDGDDEIGVDAISIWVEPSNRLATLLFLMGRYAESKVICERILEVKPWHIGALSGVVLVCLKLSDGESARYWAMRGLPSATKDMYPLRQAWVERNVLKAKNKLKEMEVATKEAFGPGYYNPTSDDEAADGTDGFLDDSDNDFTPLDTILDYEADAALFGEDDGSDLDDGDIEEYTLVEEKENSADTEDDFRGGEPLAWQ